MIGSLRGEVLERVAPSWLAQMPSLYDEHTAERLERKILGATQHRMLREGVDAFESLAADDLVVVVLEDLHWADGNTLDVIEMLTMRTESAQLLIVCTARREPGPTAELIGRLTAAGRAEELRLEIGRAHV